MCVCFSRGFADCRSRPAPKKLEHETTSRTLIMHLLATNSKRVDGSALQSASLPPCRLTSGHLALPVQTMHFRLGYLSSLSATRCDDVNESLVCRAVSTFVAHLGVAVGDYLAGNASLFIKQPRSLPPPRTRHQDTPMAHELTLLACQNCCVACHCSCR